MKSQKVSESIPRRKRRVPEEGTAAYRRWRKNVVAGRRRSRLRRREAGLLTIAEVAEKHGISVTFVRRMADRRELAVLDGGARRYIRESEAERVFGRPQQGTAA